MTESTIKVIKLLNNCKGPLAAVFTIFSVAVGTFFAWSALTSHPIKTIKSFDQVDLDKIGPETLVVFDIDNTLVQLSDAYFSASTRQIRKSFFDSLLKLDRYKNLTESEVAYIKDFSLFSTPMPPVEKNIGGKISILQKKGVKVIACTHYKTGDTLKHTIEQWRFETLKKAGIIMSLSDQAFDFKGFQAHPKFYKGIILTDGQNPKGPLVAEFIKKMEFGVSKVIFFDDDKHFVESVFQAVCGLGLAFQGYHYLGMKHHGIKKSFDYDLALFQHDYLLEHGKWLSDEQATPLMEKRDRKVRGLINDALSGFFKNSFGLL